MRPAEPAELSRPPSLHTSQVAWQNEVLLLEFTMYLRLAAPDWVLLCVRGCTSWRRANLAPRALPCPRPGTYTGLLPGLGSAHGGGRT